MGFMVLYLFSLTMGGFGAWLLMKYGASLGINDIPNHRSSHIQAIPKGGGIGILMVLVIVSMILSIPMGFWMPAFIIALVSLWGGDKHLLSPKERLIIQFACSFIFLIFCGYFKAFGLLFALSGVPLSVFIVGTSNFYNFMDGIDGIAGITGVVGFFLMAFYSYILGSYEPYGVLCIALAFSCFGFLCFNMPKARVFLGDIGSILLGFIFSCLVIVLSENIIDFIVMAGFLAPFYFDELFTMVGRIKDGDSLILAHRKHIYQLLANEFGISHWKISLGYGFAQLIIGLSVIFIKSQGIYLILSTYLFYGLIFAKVSIIIRKKVFIKCK